MKKRNHERLPIVSVSWHNKQRVSVKYSRKQVDKWLANVAMYPYQNAALLGGDQWRFKIKNVASLHSDQIVSIIIKTSKNNTP